MTFAPLAIPEWRGEPDDAAEVVARIDAWVASDALHSVVAAFGGDVPRSGGDDALGYLDGFSSAHWDFRRGRERDSLAATGIDPEVTAVVMRAALALGQSGRTVPQRGHYDSIVLTGGMVRAGLVKPRFVASLLARGVTADEIVFLGAHRRFSAPESELARLLDVDGDDEVDAMSVGMVRAFGLGIDECRVSTGGEGTGAWSTIDWTSPERRYRVVAAPSADPSRRADTAATFRLWGSTCAPGRRVLVVTTPVYVPYQATVATETLGLGGGSPVETVGTDAAANDLGVHTQEFLATHHVQELRSAVRAMRSLRAAAVAEARRPGSSTVAHGEEPRRNNR
ncbi:hypothetical protein [Marisediminicola sp. LYQ134]|uniref:hypothetical protein n=1 Tax=unclassified Marisediminicola TaxID=2618316 RepID=UPI003982ED68